MTLFELAVLFVAVWVLLCAVSFALLLALSLRWDEEQEEQWAEIVRADFCKRERLP